MMLEWVRRNQSQYTEFGTKSIVTVKNLLTPNHAKAQVIKNSGLRLPNRVISLRFININKMSCGSVFTFCRVTLTLILTVIETMTVTVTVTLTVSDCNCDRDFNCNCDTGWRDFGSNSLSIT